MAPGPPATLHGVTVDLDLRFVDRAGGAHRVLCAGPYLRCLEHTGKVAADNVAEALATMSHSRTCDRLRIAWQRLMLADDRSVGPVLRDLPRPLAAYLAAQTRAHAERLDAALLPDTDTRTRRRWHNVGWRAAPTLAGRYQRAGVEAGVAFLALRRGVKPDEVVVAVDDKHNPVGAALRNSRLHKHVQLLDLGFRQTVTDDFPYEPLAPGPRPR